MNITLAKASTTWLEGKFKDQKGPFMELVYIPGSKISKYNLCVLTFFLPLLISFYCTGFIQFPDRINIEKQVQEMNYRYRRQKAKGLGNRRVRR